MLKDASSHWVVRRAAGPVVGEVLRSELHGSHSRPDLEAALLASTSQGAGQASDQGGVLALTERLEGVDEDTWGSLITGAAREFRAAEACLTGSLGPGMSVEIDEGTWEPQGLPAAVLGVAFCTTSLVTAWATDDGGWCVLEMHQATGEGPIAVIVYRVHGDARD